MARSIRPWLCEIELSSQKEACGEVRSNGDDMVVNLPNQMATRCGLSCIEFLLADLSYKAKIRGRKNACRHHGGERLGGNLDGLSNRARCDAANHALSKARRCHAVDPNGKKASHGGGRSLSRVIGCEKRRIGYLEMTIVGY